MFATIEHVFSIVFPVVWIGGTLALFLWARVKTSDYLKRFPPVEGVPLNMYSYIPRESPRIRQAGREAMLSIQPDHELEAMRIAMWKRYIYGAAWALGFPTVVTGIAFIVAITHLPQ